jgi:hypothetical protein
MSIYVLFMFIVHACPHLWADSSWFLSKADNLCMQQVCIADVSIDVMPVSSC